MAAVCATPPPAQLNLETPSRNSSHTPNTSKTYKHGRHLQSWTPNVATSDTQILITNDPHEPSYDEVRLLTQASSQRNSVSPRLHPYIDIDYSFDTRPMPNKGRPRGESDLGRAALRVRRESNGYGFPSSGPESPLPLLTEQQSSSHHIPYELLTAILIPLPYLLSSLLNIPEAHINHAQHPTKIEAAEEILEEVASSALPVPTSSPSLIQACALTAGTLLIIGLFGRLKSSHIPLDRRKANSVTGRNAPTTSTSLFSWSSIKRILLRMVTVGLPFLATVEIGGVRTGMVLLGAAACGLLGTDSSTIDQPPMKPWKRALKTRTWSCAVFFLCILCDLFWLRTDAEPASLIRGYIALTKSVLFLQPPFPNTTSTSSRSTISRVSSFNTTTSNPSSPWEVAPMIQRYQKQRIVSSLIQSKREANITFLTGAILGFVTALLSFILGVGSPLNFTTFVISVASMISAGAIFFFARPLSLCSPLKGGYGFGIIICAMYGYWFDSCTPSAAVALSGMTCLSFVAMQLDTRLPNDVKHTHAQTQVEHHRQHHVAGSRFTHFLLRRLENSPLMHSIIREKESRRIIYFMSVNLLFMFVQTFYAFVSGSLGLLSDSIHMFFDCVGLLAGLVAAIMSKWPPNAKFPYGYGKVETLSGLGNGIFLIIISVEIIWESMQRFLEGTELRRVTELLVVSVGGLIVNLIGLKFIGHHHHGHSHGGHSHVHDHSNGHAHSKENANGYTQSHSHQLDGHDHHEDYDFSKHEVLAVTHLGHSNGNENMAGIYLHILADTMGSVAVIISATLINYTGWSGWDPIASCIIAVLIIAASCPLVVGSAKKLLLTMPSEIEYTLRSTLQELSGLRGVAGYAVPRFWLDDLSTHLEDGRTHNHTQCNEHDHDHDHVHGKHHNHDHSHNHHHSEKDSYSIGHNHDHPSPTISHTAFHSGQKILGVIHVITTPSADLNDVRARVDAFLRDRNMDVLVHVEREESGARCWCGGISGEGTAGGGNGFVAEHQNGSLNIVPGATVGKRGSIIAI